MIRLHVHTASWNCDARFPRFAGTLALEEVLELRREIDSPRWLAEKRHTIAPPIFATPRTSGKLYSGTELPL